MRWFRDRKTGDVTGVSQGQIEPGGDVEEITGKEYEDACRIDEMILEGLAQVDRDAKREAEYRPQFERESG